MAKKKKITRRERDGFIKGFLLALALWFMLSPAKEYISGIFSNGIVFLIGLGVGVYALWRY